MGGGPSSTAAVVSAARQIIERGGIESLTMRRLADDLGVAVTSVYWHVGGREAVVEAVVDQFVDELGTIDVVGAEARARLASIARQFRDRVLQHRHLISAAYKHGRLGRIFQPMRAALVTELAGLGQHDEVAALSVLAIESHVVASSLLERSLQTYPPLAGADAWPAELADSDVVRAYDRLVGTPVVFDVGLELLIEAVVSGATERAAGHIGRKDANRPPTTRATR